MRRLDTSLHCWLGTGALALMLLPASVSAQEAFARNAVNLRAGPATNYPVVAVIGAGQNFQVLGCTQGYSWCDVVMPDGLRGWVFSEVIDYAYQQQRVPLANYGAVIGVPIIGFALGSYWGNNYRDRPFYDDRRWWGGRPPPPRDGWRPPQQPERPNWRPRDWDGPRPGQRGDASSRPGYQPPNVVRPPPEDRRNDPRYRPDREFGGGRPPGMRPEDSRSFDGGRQPDGRGLPLPGGPQRQVQSQRPQPPAGATPPQGVAPQAAPAPAQPMRQRGGPPSGGAAGGGREGGREGGPGGRGGGEGGGGPGGRGGGGGPGNPGRPG